MNTTETEYKVALEAYNGPMDLLLYLIKREEVDIYNIPIARITEQYLEHLEAMEVLEPGLVGDFLIMATTLMYIKSQMLLPQAPEEEEEDPRWELVKQLLEYKRFKEAAYALGKMRGEREKRVSRTVKTSVGEGEDLSLEELSAWALLGFFTRLMRETLEEVARTISIEETPVEEYMELILERLSCADSFYFLELFPLERERREIVGAFLALLELVRLRKAKVVQPLDPSDIHITRGNSFLTLEESPGLPQEG